MLSEFILMHRDDIVARTKARVRSRTWPSVSDLELHHGVPLFLTQLSEALQHDAISTPRAQDAMVSDATRHGAALMTAGLSVAQVIHDYGDICQAITELAGELQAPIRVEEFQMLNLWLDTAIAQAVTEHAQLTSEKRSDEEVERLGLMAHELRDHLNGALLAFQALKRGNVAINGSTATILGRSLTNLKNLVDRTLSEVRLAAGTLRRERLSVSGFMDEVAALGALHGEYRAVRFTVAPADSDLAVDADPQLLSSAVMNLLHNAFKNTRAGGMVTLSAKARGTRLLIEVQDQCGGIPNSNQQLFKAFGDRGGTDRSGLGLGLWIARRAVRAHGGDIQIRNLPGEGCIFTIDIPLAAIPESYRPNAELSTSEISNTEPKV